MKKFTQQIRIKSSPVASSTPENSGYRRKLRSYGVFVALFLFFVLAEVPVTLAQTFTATISSNQKFNKPIQGSPVCGDGTYGTFTSISSGSTAFCYATQSFTPPSSGNYSITCTATTASDPMLYVYNGFNAASPTSGFIVGDDDSGSGTNPSIACSNSFTGGVTYTIVVTTYNSSTTSGTVTFSISGGGVVLVLPTVSTTTASGSGTTYTLGGNVTADGGATVSARGVAYGTSTNPTSGVAIGSGTGSFSQSVSGLSSGTTYYYRAYATNSVGTSYGVQYTFVTASTSVPSVSTTTVSGVTVNSATSGVTVTNNGGAAVTESGVCWNTGGSPTTASSKTTGGSGSITSLSANTTYYVRAYATNSVGTGYGTQYSFLTLPTDPTSPVATPSTICNGTSTQLSVSNPQGTVYWYTGSCGGTQVGTGNPLTIYPVANTTYYARNINNTGSSAGCTSGLTVTVNQPASQPATASATATEKTTANVSWGGSTGLAPITYSWAVGTTTAVTYESGYAARGTTSDPTLTAAATGLTQSTTYYLRVKAANSCNASGSAYVTSGSFRTHSLLTYIAGTNGTLTGTSTQTVANGASGSAVTAVPNTGYNFLYWSDGSVQNPRTDLTMTNSITVTATFAANRLAFVTQPTDKASDQPNTVSVRVTDTYGNTMTSSTAAITLAIQNNPSIGGAGVLTGTLTVDAVDGVATFTDLRITKTGVGYTLSASAAAPIVTVPVSSSFNITPGAIDHFTVVGITDPVVAGTTTTPVVTAYDINDNIRTNHTGTIHFTSDDVQAVLPVDYTFLSGDNGVKTFTNGVTLKTTGEKTVTVTGDTKTGAQSAITVTPADINTFTLSVNGTVTAGTPFTVTATVYDQFGNIKTNYVGANSVNWTTTATTSPNGTARIIPANGEQTFVAGVATVGGFTFFNADQSQLTPFVKPTITITDAPTSSPGTTAPITVLNAPLANFKVVAGTVQSAGAPFSTTVTARDIYWNTCVDYAGSIRFKSSDDALVTFPSGLQSFAPASTYLGVRTFTNEILINVMGAYWLRAADAQFAYKSGEQQNIVVGPGAFSPLATKSTLTISDPSTPLVFVDPLNRVAGEYVLVTATPRDALGNLLYACRDISIYLNGVAMHRNGSGNTSIGIPVTNVGDGSYTALVRVSLTGTNLITASFNDYNPDEFFAQVRTVLVSPAPVDLAHTLITADPSTMTTDEYSNITVQLKDVFDNNRTISDGTVALLTSRGVLTGGVTDNNNGTYSAILYGNYGATGIAHITGSFTGNSQNLSINGPITDTEDVTITEGVPALATIMITANPEVITTNQNSLISVQLKDQFGNLITTDRGTVELDTDLGVLSVVAYTSGGIYTSTLSGFNPGFGPATITGTYNGDDIDDDATVTFNEGLPDLAEITITASPETMTSDGSSFITVQLKDEWGNLITTSRGTVLLTSDKGALNTVIDHNDGTYTATLTGDNRGFGNATITGTLEGSAIEDDAVVIITEGKPDLTDITITPASGTMTTDETRLITVQLKDQFGNNLTTSRGTVTLFTSLTGTALNPVTDHANGTYSATLSTTVTGTATITGHLVDAPDGIDGDIADDAEVIITEGKPALAMIEITASPISITTDETSTITIQLRDQHGNNLSTQRGDITLTAVSKGSISAATYQTAGYYTATLSGDNRGVGATLITGVLTDVADGVTGTIADNAEVTFTEGLPSLAISDISVSNATITTDGSSTVSVQLKDQFGNLIINNRGTVTLTSTIGLLSAVSYTANGIYTATLTGDTRGVNGTGISAITGSFAGTGTASGVNGDFTDGASVTITEGLPALATTVITAAPTTMTTDQTSTITVQLKDQFGNLITHDRSTVTLSTTLGILTGGVTAGANDGIYTATLYGNDSGTGLATISGALAGDVVGSVADNATVLITDGAPSLTMTTITASPESITSDEASTITVQLKDQFGNSLISSRGTVTLLTNLGVLTVVTDNLNGSYTATLTANNSGFGDATITGKLDGSGIADNAVVEITEGKPALATISISPADSEMTTDETTLISVQLKDQWGNNLTTQRGTVALSTTTGALTTPEYISNGIYTATLSTTVTGTATITGILTDVADGVTGTISDNAVVVIGEGKPALAMIQITASPTSITTDETSTITIQLKDQWGNNLSTQRGDITLTAVSIGSIGAATYQTAGYYTATLSGDNRGVGATLITGVLTDVADGVTGPIADDATVTFTEGLPSLAISDISVSDATITTDGSSTVSVQLKDQFGNLIINNRGTVTLTSTIGLLSAVSYTANGIYTATLTGDTRGVNGTGISAISGSFAGTGTAIGVSGAFTDGASVTITEGLPALATTVITAVPTTMTTDETSTITVQLVDQFGNLITHDRSTVALSTNLGVLTANGVYAGNGTYTAILHGNNTGVGTATITGTLAGVVAGNIADNTTTVEITEGLPSLVTTTITPASATMTTDETDVITVQLKDQFGNLIINNRGTVALSATIGGLTAVSYAGAGTYTATLSGDTRGTNGTGLSSITGTFEGSALGLSASVTITEGLPDLITSTFGASPTTITTDETSLITVQLKDHLTNNITHSRGTVALSTDLGALTVVTDNNNGTYTATLSANNTNTGIATISGGLTGEVTGAFTDNVEVLITEGLPVLAQIQITADPTSITADETSTITVQLKDQWGNNLTSSRGSIALSSAYLTGTDISTVADNGNGTYTATFSMIAYGTGTATITGIFTGTGNAAAVHGNITDNATIDVSHGVATKLAILTQPSATATAGVVFAQQPVVRIEDQFGNLVLSDNTTVLTAARATGTDVLKGTLTATATAGIATFTGLYYTKAETITLGISSSPALTAVTSTNIVVGHAPIDHFTLSAPNNFMAGTARVAYTVTRWDEFENLVTTGAQTTYLYSSSTGLNKKFYGVAIGGSAITQLSIANESSTANFWYYDEKTGDHTITASDHATAPDGDVNINDGTDQITVTPALLKDFIVYGIQNPHDLGTLQSVTVEPRDTYNNRKTNYVGTITFSNTDLYAVNPADYHYLLSDAGIHTFNNGVLFSQTGSWWLTAIDLVEPTKYGAQADIIVQRAVSIVANNRSKTYGDVETLGAMSISNCTVTGIVAGVNPVAGEITGITLTSTGSVATASVAGSTYPIVPSLATGTYDPTYYRIVYSEAGQLTVNPATLAVTANAEQTKVYGESDPTPFTYTATGFKNDQTVSIMTGSLDREPGEYVGDYEIGQGDLSAGSNYTISYTADNFSITPKPVTVLATAEQSKVYGQVDPTFAYTSNVPLAFSDVFVGALAREAGEDVAADYALEIGSLSIEDGDDFNVASNYTISFTSADFAITQLTLAVTANEDQSKIYGQLDPIFTYTSAPAVGFELPNGHSIAFTGSLTRDAGEPVGTYAINQGSLANANYAIGYTSKTFAITPLAVTLTANAGQSKEYGDSDPTFTYTSDPIVGSALANGILISYTGLLDRVEGENVGNYAIGLGDVDNSNYTISYVSHDFAITRKAIAITVTPDQTKVYGITDPTFAYTTSPLVGSLPFTASFTGALVRETGQVVGTEYTITQGSLELVDANNLSGGSLAANYAITFNEADFAITRKPITITVDEGIAKLYGAADPEFTYTSSPVLSGLPYGAAFIGSLVRLNTNENVNTYTITQGSLELQDDNNATTSLYQNYDVTFNTDVLTINKRAITIAVVAGQSKVYADADPVFTYTPSIALFYNGTFTGALNRAAGENVANNYAIGRGTLNVDDDNNPTTSLDDNYDLTFIPANFEITKKPITIAVNSGQNKVYGNDDPEFTYVSSVDPLPFAGLFTGSLERLNTDQNVATDFEISRGSLQIEDANHVTSLDANYTLNFVSADFAITRRPITLTANNRTKTYGDLLNLGNIEFGITGDGMAYGETIIMVALTSLGTPVQANIGTYAIATANAVGAYDVSNYNVTYSSAGTLTVGVRTLHLTYFAADSKTYDGNTVATGIGFIDDRITGDVLSFQRDAAFDTKDAGANKPVYYTNIAITGGSDMLNYVLESTTGTAYASIFAKALTVTASDDSRLYSGSPYSGGNGVTYNGFIAGESAANLTGTLSYGGTSQGATEVGDYVITPQGLTSANYTYTYVDGNLSIFANLSVSGNFKYYNSGLTPMNNVKVELWSVAPGVPGVPVAKLYPVDGDPDVVTNSAGEYSFSDVSNGNYIVVATTNKSIAYGAYNSTDALTVFNWIYNFQTLEKVRFFAGDVSMSNRLASLDAGNIMTNFTAHGTQGWAGRENWTFWSVGETFSSNPNANATLYFPGIVVDNNSITSNFYGLATGDFNMSFVPGNDKSLSQSLTLNHDAVREVKLGEVIDLPVNAGMAMEVGAVSLIMNFPSDKLEILSVYLGSDESSPLSFGVDGEQIRIGWYSGNPIWLNAGENLLTIKVRVIGAIALDELVRFELNSDPLNELTDGDATIIDGASLKMAEIGTSLPAGELTLSNFPNPFSKSTTFDYTLPSEGKVSIEITNMLGSTVKILLNATQSAGNHTLNVLTTDMNPGIYTATLRVSSPAETQTRSIKIICKQ